MAASLNSSDSKPPLFPRLKDHTRVRTLSTFRSPSEAQKGGTKPLLSLAISTGKIDKALDGVKRDIWELWVKSKYVREFPGILTYSPTIDIRDTGEVVGKPEIPPSRSPFPLLFIGSKTPYDLEDPQIRRQTSTKSPAILRFSSPSPSFPLQKPKIHPIRKAYSPHSVRTPSLSRKSTTDLKAFELISPEDIAKLKAAIQKPTKRPIIDSERGKKTVFANDPVELYASLPSTPRAKSGILGRKTTERGKFAPSWNEKCLKVTKLPHKPTRKGKKSAEM